MRSSVFPKPDERFVFDYLLHRGFPQREIGYEPLGPGTTPDFLVGGNLAIEVRRLNQHHNIDGIEVPGEQLAAAVHSRLQKVLAKFGPARPGCNWFVLYTFRRPLSAGWEQEAQQKLVLFANGEATVNETSFAVGENLHLQLIRRSDVDGDCLEYGGCSDVDQGGFVIPVLEKNLEIAIRDKIGKTAKARAQNPGWKWWLILVDHINGGGSAGVCVPHDFDKVIVICPEFLEKAYEVVSKS